MAEKVIGIVGLGYVGLPLALAFGKKFRTIGFDLSQEKIDAYLRGEDPTREVDSKEFLEAKKIEFSSSPAPLEIADYIVVSVPTPVDDARRPDLTMIIQASEMVGRHLKRGALVVYESTVYPGLTEEVCVPVLEKVSGFKCGEDFKVGYSPERINPGDREHTLSKITKVVAGQDAESLEEVAWLYSQVVEAGVHRASSIKVAEAAKVIENTQRDLNIALMNELAIIFDRLDIDTHEVLEAAGTKWNFLKFQPGLVGGHCIGVDPYYLTFRSEMAGYHPQVVLAGRRINDGMGKFVAEKTVKQMITAGHKIRGAEVLVMGLTFKENCEDLRNSRVIDIISELHSLGVKTRVWDPVARKEEAKKIYDIDLCRLEDLSSVQAVIAAVPHQEVLDLDLSRLSEISKPHTPFMDVKSAFEREKLTKAGFQVWRL